MDMMPCKGCLDRFVGCHSTCAKYAEFRAKLDEINAKRVAKRKEMNDYWSVLNKKR